MTQGETQELKPCPFCGGKAMVEEFRDGDDPQPLFVATCEVCPVKTYDQFSAQEAIRVWNARPYAGPLFPSGDWSHLHIPNGNQKVVAISFETPEQASAFINRFATSSVAATVDTETVAETVAGAAHPEDFCHKCGRPNVVWFAPNELWNKAVREVGAPEILCPVCFVQLAEVTGISAVWKVAPEGYHEQPSSPQPREAAMEAAEAIINYGESVRWGQHEHPMFALEIAETILRHLK